MKTGNTTISDCGTEPCVQEEYTLNIVAHSTIRIYNYIPGGLLLL